MSEPARGEIWWAEAPDEQPRPYLILTRDEAIPVLNKVLAAAVTRTVRGIPSEVALGPSEGLKTECAASMDNIAPIRKSYLVRRIGALSRRRRHELCEALSAAVDC